MSSAIEWTDKTWNPVVGCTPVSPGCLNCYAARMAERQAGMKTKGYAGLTTRRDGRAVYNGRVRCLPSRLGEPLKWRRSCMVFPCSMSDLFHEAVPFKFIARVFGTMQTANHHTYQLLTKRPDRAAAFYKWFCEEWLLPGDYGREFGHVWLGTTVESPDQVRRIADLLLCPAAVRFLSAEPLLGPLDLTQHHWTATYAQWLDWVIVGGESGPKARPMDPAWARSLRDQCVEAGTPFFFKQWGGTNKKATGRALDGRTWDQMPQAAA